MRWLVAERHFDGTGTETAIYKVALFASKEAAEQYAAARNKSTYGRVVYAVGQLEQDLHIPTVAPLEEVKSE